MNPRADPAQWAVGPDPASGEEYWYNCVTEESQWEPPVELTPTQVAGVRHLCASDPSPHASSLPPTAASASVWGSGSTESHSLAYTPQPHATPPPPPVPTSVASPHSYPYTPPLPPPTHSTIAPPLIPQTPRISGEDEGAGTGVDLGGRRVAYRDVKTGWQQHFSKRKQRWYWWNSFSNKTRWTRPKGVPKDVGIVEEESEEEEDSEESEEEEDSEESEDEEYEDEDEDEDEEGGDGEEDDDVVLLSAMRDRLEREVVRLEEQRERDVEQRESELRRARLEWAGEKERLLGEVERERERAKEDFERWKGAAEEQWRAQGAALVAQAEAAEARKIAELQGSIVALERERRVWEEKGSGKTGDGEGEVGRLREEVREERKRVEEERRRAEEGRRRAEEAERKAEKLDRELREAERKVELAEQRYVESEKTLAAAQLKLKEAEGRRRVEMEKKEGEVGEKVEEGKRRAEVERKLVEVEREVEEERRKLVEERRKVEEARLREEEERRRREELERKVRSLEEEVSDGKRALESAERRVEVVRKRVEELERGLGAVEDRVRGEVRASMESEWEGLLAKEKEAGRAREVAAVAATEAAAEERIRGIAEEVRSLERRRAEARLGEIQLRLEEAEGRVRREAAGRRAAQTRLLDALGTIRVFVRCRPVAGRGEAERRGDGVVVVSFPDEESVHIAGARAGTAVGAALTRGSSALRRAAKDVIAMASDAGELHRFRFDRAFAMDATQQDVYEEVAPVVEAVLDGRRACIFAYGQTGSGKTHTMEGPARDPGVNRRAIAALFHGKGTAGGGEADEGGTGEGAEETTERHVELRVSALEIYNEEIRDLLAGYDAGEAPPEGAVPMIRGGKRGEASVEGVTLATATNVTQVDRALAYAHKRRAVGAHDMNEHSSRSHLVITVHLPPRSKGERGGRLMLIDLAGSERVGKTGATGDRLAEAKAINKSLSALGDVIAALGAKQSAKGKGHRGGHVPFRNSKLTHLLQDSIDGGGIVLMLVCISPTLYNAAESVCSLKFAQRCRAVVTSSAGPETARHLATIAKLREEVKLLKTERRV